MGERKRERKSIGRRKEVEGVEAVLQLSSATTVFSSYVSISEVARPPLF